MKNSYLLLLMAIILSCNSRQDKNTAHDSTLIQTNYPKDSMLGRGTFLDDKELEYIKTRDRQVEYFQKHSDPKVGFEKLEKQHKDSLLELERIMREIMKDSRVSDGQNNLLVLYNDMGFDILDGLYGIHDSMGLFGITKNLFFYYFMDNKINQLDQLTLTDFDKILNSAFASDAHITPLTTIRLPSENNVQAYGIVTYEAQDIGPFSPDEIYVFVANDKYVYIASRKLDVKLDEVKACRHIWDSLIAKPGADDNMEDYAQDKYCECCQQGYQNEPQFDNIKKEMETMVQHILH